MMKYLVFLLVLISCTSDDDLDSVIVEASCGQCQFKLDGEGCDLAIRHEGKSYWVDGTDIDDHGDAHASDGFCEAIRKAEVTGRFVNGRFQAEKFALVKEE